MQLELLIYPITGLRWGAATRLVGGTLEIDRAALARHLLEDARLAEVELELAAPGESCRVGPVFDIVEPRAKVGGGVDFPGALGPATSAGQGQTAVLRGAAVTVVDPGQTPYRQAFLDLSGPAADVSIYQGLHHLVVLPRPAPEVDELGLYGALRHASLRAAVYLARAAADSAPATRESYALAPLAASTLPRVAYVFQIHSHQHPTRAGEPILYGDNVRYLLPTILHPNEVLDGAVIRNYRGLSLDTYSIQNHPIIHDLYARHGSALDFAGVVVTVAHQTLPERERAVTMAANLVAHTLRAEGAVLSKSGGGAPHVDMAQIAQRLETLGVRTTMLAWQLASSDSVEDGGALFNFPELDAIVNYGRESGQLALPAVDRVLAGSPAAAARLAGPLTLGFNSICGAMDQLGAGRLTAVTY